MIKHESKISYISSNLRITLSSSTHKTEDMKFSITISLVILVILQLTAFILASPPKGGIGDGFIYPVTQKGSKPKTTTTYYAKPLHPPAKKRGGPKPKVYKVIIHDQPPPRQEQIFKIIHLPKHAGGSSGGGGRSHQSKSIKIIKIIQVKQPKGGHGGGWSK